MTMEIFQKEQDIPLADHSRSIQLFGPPGCEGLNLVLSSEQYLDLPGHLSQSLRFKMTCLDNDGQLGQRTLKAISVDREADFQLSRVHASLHLPLRCV